MFHKFGLRILKAINPIIFDAPEKPNELFPEIERDDDPNVNPLFQQAGVKDPNLMDNTVFGRVFYSIADSCPKLFEISLSP